MAVALSKLDIYTTWQKLSRFPGGKWLFSLLIGKTAPYSGSISARVAELSPGKAVVTLADRHSVRNHLRSIHAIALVNLGELCSGLALHALMPHTHRGIIRGISMQYHKKARGLIRAECQVGDIDWALQNQDSLLSTLLYDQEGDMVARAEVNWRIGWKDLDAAEPKPAPENSA